MLLGDKHWVFSPHSPSPSLPLSGLVMKPFTVSSTLSGFSKKLMTASGDGEGREFYSTHT